MPCVKGSGLFEHLVTLGLRPQDAARASLGLVWLTADLWPKEMNEGNLLSVWKQSGDMTNQYSFITILLNKFTPCICYFAGHSCQIEIPIPDSYKTMS